MPDPIQSSGYRLEETKRIARVLEIVQMIAVAPHCYSRRDLAERFEISERMIQKDLDVVRHGLKLSLLHDGRRYFFERLPHLPTTTYSFAEALALLTAARAAQAFPGVNSAELSAAIARLEAVFPNELRPYVKQGTEKLPTRAAANHRQDMLAVLHRALIERRQVKIIYATGSRAGKVSERIVEPYHILPYGRSWQLIAFDHRRGDTLQFKVDRVQSCELLNTRYSIPDDFDVDAYLCDAWGLMRGAAAEAETVVVLFEPEAGRWVAEEQWHHSQQSETLADERVKLTFHVGVTPEMVNWLLYYGSRVRVLEPAWLQEQVVVEHQKAVGMHQLEQSNQESEYRA